MMDTTDGELSKIINFLRLSQRLLTAGMPEPQQLNLLKQAGVDMVINLAMGHSPGAIAGEKEILNSLGIGYTHIPVEWEHPRLSDLALFFEVMEKNEGKTVFVHCVLNMRVSVFAYLYHILRKGMPPGQAIKNVHEIWEPDEVWQVFIDQAVRHYQG